MSLENIRLSNKGILLSLGTTQLIGSIATPVFGIVGTWNGVKYLYHQIMSKTTETKYYRIKEKLKEIAEEDTRTDYFNKLELLKRKIQRHKDKVEDFKDVTDGCIVSIQLVLTAMIPVIGYDIARETPEMKAYIDDSENISSEKK